MGSIDLPRAFLPVPAEATSNIQQDASSSQQVATRPAERALASHRETETNHCTLKRMGTCLLLPFERFGSWVNQLLGRSRSIQFDLRGIREDILNDGKIFNNAVSAAQKCRTDAGLQAQIISLTAVVLSAREYLEVVKASLKTACQLSMVGNLYAFDTRIDLLLKGIFPGSTRPLSVTCDTLNMTPGHFADIRQSVDNWYVEVQLLRLELEQAMEQLVTAAEANPR